MPNVLNAAFAVHQIDLLGAPRPMRARMTLTAP